MPDRQYPSEFNSPEANRVYSESDLPIDDEGRIYHLQLKPDQVAQDIVLVGDPGRAEMIGSTFLRDLDFEHEHRGLVTITGTSQITGKAATIISPQKTTVATSGMGTPSLEIVINELVILNEIDFKTRMRKPKFPRLHVLRVGTSGALQETTALGTPIITSYAVGMDNTGMFYDAPYPDKNCARLEGEIGDILQNEMPSDSRFFGKIRPYVSKAEPILVQALLDASEKLGVTSKVGLTVSNPGFFAPQGRDTCRLKPSLPDLDKIFSDYDPKVNDQYVENMEMEASFLIHFLSGLGYWAGAICPGIANRQKETFYVNYQNAVENAIEIALLALADLRRQYPDVSLG